MAAAPAGVAMTAGSTTRAAATATMVVPPRSLRRRPCRSSSFIALKVTTATPGSAGEDARQAPGWVGDIPHTPVDARLSSGGDDEGGALSDGEVILHVDDAKGEGNGGDGDPHPERPADDGEGPRHTADVHRVHGGGDSEEDEPDGEDPSAGTAVEDEREEEGENLEGARVDAVDESDGDGGGDERRRTDVDGADERDVDDVGGCRRPHSDGGGDLGADLVGEPD